MIETRFIDYVPDDERHGKVGHQGPFRFVGNFQPFTLATGLRRPQPGLCRCGGRSSPASPASRSAPCSWRSTPPRDRCCGCPQMIQSRAAVRLPRRAAAPDRHAVHLRRLQRRRRRDHQIGLQSIFGWNPVAGRRGDHRRSPRWSRSSDMTCLHKTFRVLFWISLPLWIVLTGGVLFGAG